MKKIIGLLTVFLSVLFVNFVSADVPASYVPSTNTYTCNIVVGEKCIINIANANNYLYIATEEGLTSYVATSTGISITGLKPGTTRVTSKNYPFLKVELTIRPLIRNLASSVGTLTLAIGDSGSFSITDGNGGYTAVSNNTSIATVAGSNTNWTVSSKGIGLTTVLVKDSQGRSILITIIVTERNLIVNPTSLNINYGQYADLKIVDGNGGYTITTNNNNVIVSSNGTNSYKVYGNKEGTSTLTIKDSKGKTVTLMAGVKIKNLNTSTININTVYGNVTSFTIEGGNGVYSVTSSDQNIVSVASSGNNYTRAVTGKGLGTTMVVVKDGAGKQAIVTVTVMTKQLSANKTNWEMKVGESFEFIVTSGNGKYTTTYDANYLDVSKKNSNDDTVWVVKAKKEGYSAITIKDTSNQKWNIGVTVKK